MIETEVAAALTQFGVAGLIGWMWLSERRASAAREKQISEAHDQIRRERTELDVLVAALGDNTRALSALESGQRELVALLTRFLRPARPPGEGG